MCAGARSAREGRPPAGHLPVPGRRPFARGRSDRGTMNPSDGVRCRWDEYEAARERFLSRFEARRGARPSGARAPEPDPEMLDALPPLRVEVRGMLRSGDRMSAPWHLAGPSADGTAAPREVSGLAVWRFADRGIAAERIHDLTPAVHPPSRGSSEEIAGPSRPGGRISRRRPR